MAQLDIVVRPIRHEAGKRYAFAEPATPYTAADRDRGILYAVYYDVDLNDVYLATSVDKGETWTHDMVYDAGTWLRGVNGGPALILHNGRPFVLYTVYDGVDDYRMFMFEKETLATVWTQTDVTPFSVTGESNPEFSFNYPQFFRYWDSGNSRFNLCLSWTGRLTASGDQTYIVGRQRNEDTKVWGSAYTIFGMRGSGSIGPGISGGTYGRGYRVSEMPSGTGCNLEYTPYSQFGLSYYSSTPLTYQSLSGGTGWGYRAGYITYYSHRGTNVGGGIVTPDGVHQGMFTAAHQYGGSYYTARNTYLLQIKVLSPYENDPWNADDTTDIAFTTQSSGHTGNTVSCSYNLNPEGGVQTLWSAFDQKLNSGGVTYLFLQKNDMTNTEGRSTKDWEPGLAEGWYLYQTGAVDVKHMQLWAHPRSDTHVVTRGAMGVFQKDVDSNDRSIYWFGTPDLEITFRNEATLELTAQVQPYIRAHTADAPNDTSTASSTTTVIDLTTGGLTPNQWVGSYIRFSSGTESGEIRKIIANTASTITVEYAFGAAPGSGDAFQVIDLDTYDVNSLFDNVYEDGTGYVYAVAKYVNYHSSSLASVVWDPAADWGQIWVGRGSSDSWAEGVSPSITAYAPTLTINTWTTGESQGAWVWYRWQNTATPQYGPIRFSVDISVTE